MPGLLGSHAAGAASWSPPIEIDESQFAFRPDGPWRVGGVPRAWGAKLAALRARAHAEVAVLARPGRLPPLARFLEAAWRLSGALLGWALRERRRGGAASRAGLSHRLRDAFERLGPAYIKLGQILSAGRGVFPEELVREFRTLRDRVAPERFEDVRRVVEEDLGRPLEEVFARFEREPLASASIAQVHAATLRSGEPVVVKVQRPRVARDVRRDVRAMAWIAPHLVGRIPVAALANPPVLVELFAETVLEELDFRLEAENVLDVGRVLAGEGASAVFVPRPHPELVTRRVLVMEHLEGFAFEDVDAMRRAGVDTTEVLRLLVLSFLEGAMIHGVFHGDLHGGNLFVTPEGRIALLDFGITGRMDEAERRAFLRMLMLGAVGDLRGQIEAFRDLGALAPDADAGAIVEQLGLEGPVKDPTKMNAEELTREIQTVTRALLGFGARLPKPLMLYVKNVLFLDDAVGHLAPGIDLFAELLRIYGWFAGRHGARLAADSGVDPRAAPVDLDRVRASLGIDEPVDTLRHDDLVARREEVRRRLAGE